MKFQSIKCFFGKHIWWHSNLTQIQKGMLAAYIYTKCCVACGAFRADPSGFDENRVYERWQEMAGCDTVDTIPPLSENLRELKHLVDSSNGLDLSKMDIDVESFKKADEELENE